MRVPMVIDSESRLIDWIGKLVTNRMRVKYKGSVLRKCEAFVALCDSLKWQGVHCFVY